MNGADKTPQQACGKHEEMVAYLYQEATPDEASRFEAHLSGCSACRDELAAFGRVRDQLQQWQVADLPVVRVVAEPRPQKRSFGTILKELLLVMPLWVKAAGVAALALVILAATGTQVSIGREGFSISSGFVSRRPPDTPGIIAPAPTTHVQYVSTQQLEQLRADLSALVAEKVLESERQQKEQVKAELVALQSEIKNLRTADLAKIVARVQEHQSRLSTIERDLDRREGSDITDLLFSELTNKENRATGASRGD